MLTAKDPNRQLQGKLNKDRGKRFEELLESSFSYYRRTGFALVEKTPEPIRQIGPMDQKRCFKACYAEKAQPDYKGVLKGGREIIFEAKYTVADKMEQSRVKPHQAQYMRHHQELGARCYVLAGFGSGKVYKIPWDVWDGMKERFGKKTIHEYDLRPYIVPMANNGVLMLFADTEDCHGR